MGEVMMDSQLSLNCTTLGKSCPELNTWKSNHEKKNFEDCFRFGLGTKSLPPIRCRPYRLGNNKARTQVENQDMKDVCWIEERAAYVRMSGNCTETERLEDCERGKWSNQWVEEDSGVKCTRRDPWIKFRFCRKSDRCVIMEVEKKFAGDGEECVEEDLKEEYWRIKDKPPCKDRIG